MSKSEVVNSGLVELNIQTPAIYAAEILGAIGRLPLGGGIEVRRNQAGQVETLVIDGAKPLDPTLVDWMLPVDTQKVQSVTSIQNLKDYAEEMLHKPDLGTLLDRNLLINQRSRARLEDFIVVDRRNVAYLNAYTVPILAKSLRTRSNKAGHVWLPNIGETQVELLESYSEALFPSGT